MPGTLKETRRSPRAGLPLLTSLLFAGSYVAAEVTTLELRPLSVTLLRYLVAVTLLLPLAAARGALVRVPTPQVVRFAALGAFGILGYHVLFFSSLRFTTVANTAIINAVSPVVTAVLAAGLARDRLPLRAYGGVLVAVAGVLLLVTDGGARLAAVDFNRGDLLMLGAVASWAVYALLVQAVSTRYSALTITVYAVGAGVLMLIPLAARDGVWRQLREISPAAAVAVLYMGWGASGLGYWLYNAGVRDLGATRMASVVYGTVPMAVSVLAWIAFGEPITVLMIASMALVVAGLHFVLRIPQPPSPGEPRQGGTHGAGNEG